MPKMKSHRGAAKRFRVSGSGRVRRASAGAGHLMRGKSANRLRRLRKNSMVDSSDEQRIAKLLPYSF